MKTICLKSPSWQVQLKPCAAKKYQEMDQILRELLAIWLYEGQSTGDCMVREDVWSLATQAIGLLRCDATEGSPAIAELVEFISDDPELTESLLFTQDFEIQYFDVTGRRPELTKLKPSQLVELHRFDPKKKLQAALNQYRSMLKENQVATLPPETSPSNPAGNAA